jgi:hypothetical protein
MPDGTVNTYVPLDIPSVQGDVTRFLDVLTKLLPDDNDRAILLAYMASCAQNIGVKFQWAPVLQGTEGNGKTFLADCVANAVGLAYTHRPDMRQLGEKYNSYLERSVFIIAEEIHMQGRRDLLDTLKPLVTNKMIEIRGMAADKRMSANIANWFFCTNYQDAVLKNQNDRRYSIFFTAQQSYNDIVASGMGGNYWPETYDWADSGGFAAITHFLQTYQIPAHLDPAGACHRAPRTSSTDTAITKSLGVAEQEIAEASENGTQGFRGGWISSWALDNYLRSRFMKLSNHKRSEIIEALGYVKCPGLIGGRSPLPIFEEDRKRPILYVRGIDVGSEPVRQYCEAQGYTFVPTAAD